MFSLLLLFISSYFHFFMFSYLLVLASSYFYFFFFLLFQMFLLWITFVHFTVFSLFVLLPRVLQRFFLSGVFYLTLLPAFIKASLGLPVLPLRLQGFPLRFETQTRPICLFESHNVWQI